MQKKIYIIISVSSDIGTALAKKLLTQGAQVIGTYRTMTPALKELEQQGAQLHPWSASSSTSHKLVDSLKKEAISWDGLIICHGTLNPIGNFADVSFSAWSESITTNFLSSLEILHQLLSLRNQAALNGPAVLFFAGGGTNSAPTKHSAYVVSKVALIKMCELLQAEIPDTRFSILGPGWVKTKIHQETLKAGPNQAGSSFIKTKEMLKQPKEAWVPLEKVIHCCLWALHSPAIGGRNISVEHDAWDASELELALQNDLNLFKLRRYGNNAFQK